MEMEFQRSLYQERGDLFDNRIKGDKHIVVVNQKGGVGKTFLSSIILPAYYISNLPEQKHQEVIDEPLFHFIEAESSNNDIQIQSNTQSISYSLVRFNDNDTKEFIKVFKEAVAKDKKVLVDAGAGDDTKNVIRSVNFLGDDITKDIVFIIPFLSQDMTSIEEAVNTAYAIEQQITFDPKIVFVANEMSLKKHFTSMETIEILDTKEIIEKLELNQKENNLKDLIDDEENYFLSYAPKARQDLIDALNNINKSIGGTINIFELIYDVVSSKNNFNKRKMSKEIGGKTEYFKGFDELDQMYILTVAFEIKRELLDNCMDLYRKIDGIEVEYKQGSKIKASDYKSLFVDKKQKDKKQ